MRGFPQEDAAASPSSRRPCCWGGVRYSSFPHCSVPEELSLPVGGTEGPLDPAASPLLHLGALLGHSRARPGDGQKPT